MVVSESPKDFTILGALRDVETIAAGRSVRIAAFLKKKYSGTRWRKMKGIALIEEADGWTGTAEIHWFEAHGIGRVYWKIKRRFSG